MKIKLNEKPRILITRTDRIGDLVLTTPLFEAIRNKYPEAYLSALVFVEHAAIVEGNPYLDNVFLYDKKGSEKGLWGQFCFARKVAQKKFDVVIHAHATNRMHMMSWLAGIPIRLGYNRRSPKMLTHVLEYNKKDGDRHEADYLFDLLEPFELKKPEAIESTFPICEKAMRSLDMLCTHLGVDGEKPLILMSPSASDDSKKWAPEKFAELALKLLEESDWEWGVVGTRQDEQLAEKIQKEMNSKVHNFCGRLNLATLGALMQRSKLVISNDSGPVHIAAAVGTPVVSIFGRYQPGLNAERWKPLSEDSRIVTPDLSGIEASDLQFTYIDSITVDQVYDAAKELL